MKTRERLEKAGWIYLLTFGITEVFERVRNRIFYNSKKDEVEAWYDMDSPTHQLIAVDDRELGLLCKKLK